VTTLQYVRTGFPTLDKILHPGIITPSCISVSGKFSLNQRNFLLQLTHNFLRSDRKGLYICLDHSASEIKQYFKQIKLDITPYADNYGLFFIDFFSYNQEKSKRRKIKYNPHVLLEKISSFLDWIKNGFVIIDSLSTLILNMDTNEAHDFISGLKLFGREFNLIIVGVSHAPLADLDMAVSTCDGNFHFKGEALTVDFFEQASRTVLLLSKDKDGKVILKPSLISEMESTNSILSLLSDSEGLRIAPMLGLVASPEADWCLVEDLPEKLKVLEEEKTVKKTPYCSSVRCTCCGSVALEFYLECPECGNRLLDRGEINGYCCGNGHLFSVPRIVFVCHQCGEQFGLSEAKLEKQFIYELDEKVKLQVSKDSCELVF
jgi:archaellum biogenesis ATPase FlaH